MSLQLYMTPALVTPQAQALHPQLQEIIEMQIEATRSPETVHMIKHMIIVIHFYQSHKNVLFTQHAATCIDKNAATAHLIISIIIHLNVVHCRLLRILK